MYKLPAKSTRYNSYTPFALMLFGVLLISLCDTFTVLLSGEISTIRILFFRSICLTSSMVIIEIFRTGGVKKMLLHYNKLCSFKRNFTVIPPWHFAQGMLFFLSAFCFIQSFTGEGFVIVYILSFLSVGWCLLIGYWVFNQPKPSKMALIAILICFLGACVIGGLSRPNNGSGLWITALFAGLFYGFELASTEKATKEYGTGAFETLLFSSCISLLLSLLGMFYANKIIIFSLENLYIGATGVLSLGGSLLIFAAIKAGTKTKPPIGSNKLAVVDYSILLFGAVSEYFLCKYAVNQSSCRFIYQTDWFYFFLGAIVLVSGLVLLIKAK